MCPGNKAGCIAFCTRLLQMHACLWLTTYNSFLWALENVISSRFSGIYTVHWFNKIYFSTTANCTAVLFIKLRLSMQLHLFLQTNEGFFYFHSKSNVREIHKTCAKLYHNPQIASEIKSNKIHTNDSTPMTLKMFSAGERARAHASFRLIKFRAFSFWLVLCASGYTKRLREMHKKSTRNGWQQSRQKAEENELAINLLPHFEKQPKSKWQRNKNKSQQK